jgi:small conductance mechanosensitive channel
MDMIRRFFVALTTLAILASAGLAQTSAPSPTSAPSTQPILKLHATALDSGQVDLYWYDVANAYPRYVIYRSEDGGKNYHPVGTQEGGAKTGPRYDFSDVKVDPAARYDYRLETADKTVISEGADAETPEKNLLEAAKGQTKLKLSDVASVGFWRATLDAGIDWLKGFIPQLLVAVLIFAIFYGLYRFMRHVTVRSIKGANLDPSVHELLMSALKWLILGFGIVIACDQIGIKITALLTGISIMGLAIGLAAQDTLSNLIASVVIFWDKPFKVGDWVTLNDHYGKVLRVTFRSTRILKPNGDILATPNTSVLGTQLVNHSLNPINWVNVPLGILETVPMDRVRSALLATVKGDDRIASTPPPKVVIDSIEPGEIKIFLSFCIKDEGHQSDLMQEYLEKAKNALDMIKE